MTEASGGDLTEGELRLFEECVAAHTAYVNAKRRWTVIFSALGLRLSARELYGCAQAASVCTPPRFEVPNELTERADRYLAAVERIIEAVDLLEREFGWTRTGEEMEKLADSTGAAKGAAEIMGDIRKIIDALREERNNEEDDPEPRPYMP